MQSLKVYVVNIVKDVDDYKRGDDEELEITNFLAYSKQATVDYATRYLVRNLMDRGKEFTEKQYQPLVVKKLWKKDAETGLYGVDTSVRLEMQEFIDAHKELCKGEYVPWGWVCEFTTYAINIPETEEDVHTLNELDQDEIDEAFESD